MIKSRHDLSERVEDIDDTTLDTTESVTVGSFYSRFSMIGLSLLLIFFSLVPFFIIIFIFDIIIFFVINILTRMKKILNMKKMDMKMDIMTQDGHDKDGYK